MESAERGFFLIKCFIFIAIHFSHTPLTMNKTQFDNTLDNNLKNTPSSSKLNLFNKGNSSKLFQLDKGSTP